ncbi:hypothetical protein AJ85_18730 [Alkalihalobacillus alcalophilus ATCC 27647 = CGMCC 1.3604]|uniref:SCP domain-containing protein n=1 Tax=Alkalihalobacillus alcalophilus ATCC 27647 = CGMCC 1.3604 TaxID=1218173 RepID=A0A094WIC6_ALKAL|nr:CAP domain-containing protein [Alkalihalobacillus alcalophilus]KGA96581.1 hypothetical protein BALCAV_0215250 [Alkalihalobacillus alcalophilus ATCC 27647 = CGMCC 1.3604]MED1561180.1 CAP domain-containing protein [Alkalihalobacillus alcalophilus]THG89265.1 hypothetical protein AJ85_18730 [Alkalihalobacillus alcalophilus ATCC 27647 = CGMCC 1.3604]
MKKVIATTFLAAAIAVSGFSAQADAHYKPFTTDVKKEVTYVNSLNINSEEVSKWAESKIAQILNGYQVEAFAWKKFFFIDGFEKPNAPVQVETPDPKPEQEQEEPKEEVAPQPEKEETTPQPEPQPEVEEPKEEVQPEEEKQPEQEVAPKPEEEKQPEPQPEVEQPKEEQPTIEEQPEEQEQKASVSAEEQQMVDLVNQERQQRGLAPLKINEELTKVARVKAQDMIDNNYFDHQSPTYGSPFDMLQHFGVSYRTAGENLAGNQTVGAAHQALMNSQGHRENILNSNYTEVGIGIIDGGPYGKMFVQLFKG